MPNSQNQLFTFDSAAIEGHETIARAHHFSEVDAPSQTANNADVYTSESTLNASPDPTAEPDFLTDLDTPEQAVGVRHVPSLPAEHPAQEPPSRSRSLKMQWRFWRTLFFAGWLFYRVVFWQVYAYRWFPGWVERGNTERWRRYAREYSRFAIRMGGVFIKLGQFISTRVDILPEIIIKELEGLQDTVPTIDFKKIQSVIEAELGTIESRFEYFNQMPIAAASLGQVHRARLLNGEKVVVKVQRPGIREICYTDLDAMRVVARFAARWQFITYRVDALALVEEFGRVLLEELSYIHEAENAVRFAEMFKTDIGVYIPSIYHEHTTDTVLTMEDVTCIKINDYAALDAAGINRKVVARRLMETYLKQVFNHYFFHADPHPGNLFIYPLPVEDERADFGKDGRPFYLIFVDFGMTGTLTREIADGMVSTLSSVLNRDARGLVDAYQRLGFLLPDADINRVVEAAEETFNQVWGLTMEQIRGIEYKQITDLASEFSDLILSMPFYIPQDFLYLGRTISILSGMCTSLDPTYNPWRELQPYTEVLIARGFGYAVPQGQLPNGGLGIPVLSSLLRGDTKVLRNVGQELVRRTLPPQVNRADRVMKQIEDGELRVIAELSLTHRQQLRRLEKETRKIGRSVFFGSVLVASTILYTSGDTTLAMIGYGICGLMLLAGMIMD